MKKSLEQVGSATEPFASELIFRYNVAAKLAEALRLALDHMDERAPDRAVVLAALAEWDAS